MEQLSSAANANRRQGPNHKGQSGVWKGISNSWRLTTAMMLGDPKSLSACQLWKGCLCKSSQWMRFFKGPGYLLTHYCWRQYETLRRRCVCPLETSVSLDTESESVGGQTRCMDSTLHSICCVLSADSLSAWGCMSNSLGLPWCLELRGVITWPSVITIFSL